MPQLHIRPTALTAVSAQPFTVGFGLEALRREAHEVADLVVLTDERGRESELGVRLGHAHLCTRTRGYAAV
jgi:hypothetical protein